MGYKRQDVEQTKQYAKKFVRYKDGIALVNCEIFEKFLESFREF